MWLIQHNQPGEYNEESSPISLAAGAPQGAWLLRQAFPPPRSPRAHGRPALMGTNVEQVRMVATRNGRLMARAGPNAALINQ